jgi:hypothetical protein
MGKRMIDRGMNVSLDCLREEDIHRRAAEAN